MRIEASSTEQMYHAWKQFWRGAAAASSILLLMGCAAYEPTPLHPEESEAAYNQRTLANPQLVEFVQGQSHGQASTQSTARPDTQEANPMQWELESLTLAAMYLHPDIQAARAHALRNNEGGEHAMRPKLAWSRIQTFTVLPTRFVA